MTDSEHEAIHILKEYGVREGLVIAFPFTEKQLAEAVIEHADNGWQEWERLRVAIESAVIVLCETRGHVGYRPCRFCYDMVAAHVLGRYDDWVESRHAIASRQAADSEVGVDHNEPSVGE